MSKLSRAKIAAVIMLSVAAALAQSAPDSQLHYKVYYRCNGERVLVDHCRKDDDGLGYGPPTKPQENYCLVYYPDRPKRGGFTVQTAELYDDIVKKLQACGALAVAQPANTAPGTNQDAYYETGVQYFKAKEYAKAVPFLREAARHRAVAGSAMVYLGTAYYMLAQYQDAVVVFEQCLQLEPNDVNMQMMLGLAYAKSGKKDPAIAIYRKLQGVDSKRAQQLLSAINEPKNMTTNSFLTQGNSYLDEKQYDKAIAAYKEAIGVQPSSGAYLGLGYAYYQLEQYQNALGPFEQAVRLDASDYSNHYWVGVTHYQLKQYPEALAALQEAIRLDPKDSNSFHWVGEVYLNGFKRPDKAVAAFVESRRLDATDARNHNELGLAYDQLRQYENALTEFQEAVRLKPSEPLYQSNLGIAYLRLKNVDEAGKVQETLEKLDPKMAEELDKQIFATMYELEHANDRPNAEKKVSAQPSTDNAEAYFSEGEKHFQGKDYAKAAEFFREAVQRKPDFANAWGRLGMSYFALQRYQEALPAFQKCAQLVPSSADVEFVLGVTYLRLGNKEAALQAYEKLQTMNKDEAQKLYAAIQGEPAAPAAPSNTAEPSAESEGGPDASTPVARQLIVLGSLQESSGKTQEARENYERAIRLKPDSDTLAMAYLYLGSSYAEEKKYAEAVSSYQESLRLQPKVARTGYLLGVAYLAMGKKDEALKVYQNLQALDKDEAAQLDRQIQNAK